VTTCVVGGAGFIGAHVTRGLVRSGRDVVVLGRRAEPDRELPPGVRYVSGDYGDVDVVRALLKDADEVIDLAYSTVPKSSFEDPIFDIISNLPASVQLLREAATVGVRRLVLVSSGGTVYGVANSLPIREDHATNPISPYGITKLTIEKYAGMFQRSTGLPVAIARPANAYGEDQHAFTGQGFVATAMHSIIRGDAVGVFGGTGTTRDYVHVSDVAEGIIAILERGTPGHAYNIGTGIGTSNFEVLTEIAPLANRAGCELRTTTLPSRSFDVPANVLDSSKLASQTGWQPKVDLHTGIQRTWDAVLATNRRS